MEKHVMIIVGLTILFIGAIVAFAMLHVNEVSSPSVVWTAICPGGDIITVYVPVDCVETCGVELPAERE